MGENFVEAAKRVVAPGMNGPFVLKVYDENAKFLSFEFSARIVAGNQHLHGRFTILFIIIQ